MKLSKLTIFFDKESKSEEKTKFRKKNSKITVFENVTSIYLKWGVKNIFIKMGVKNIMETTCGDPTTTETSIVLRKTVFRGSNAVCVVLYKRCRYTIMLLVIGWWVMLSRMWCHHLMSWSKNKCYWLKKSFSCTFHVHEFAKMLKKAEKQKLM